MIDLTPRLRLELVYQKNLLNDGGGGGGGGGDNTKRGWNDKLFTSTRKES